MARRHDTNAVQCAVIPRPTQRGIYLNFLLTHVVLRTVTWYEPPTPTLEITSASFFKINENIVFWGELTDDSAKKEALEITPSRTAGHEMVLGNTPHIQTVCFMHHVPALQFAPHAPVNGFLERCGGL